MQRDGHCFLAMYDIEKAFDSVELPVSLTSLFNAEVNGKGWHLIYSWYNGCTAYVRV